MQIFHTKEGEDFSSDKHVGESCLSVFEVSGLEQFERCCVGALLSSTGIIIGARSVRHAGGKQPGASNNSIKTA